MIDLEPHELTSLNSPTARVLITGGRGTGKSETARSFAQNRGGLYLPTSPHAQISGLAVTVAEEIAVGLEQQVTGRKQLEEAVKAVAAALNIEDVLVQDPLKLSGGQTQLTVLASALVLGAPVLALDEPLLGLDTGMQQRVLDALKAYEGAVLWTSARPSAAERALATHCLELAERQERGAQVDGLALPARQPTELLLENTAISPQPKQGRRWGRAPEPRPIVRQNINLSLGPADFLLLTGANGSGKSTLLRTIAGLLEPAAGQVQVGGAAPARLSAPERVQRVQLVAQSPAHHFLAPTVAGELRLGAVAQAADSTREQLLAATGLLGRQETHPLDLLPAEQHLLTLASALAGGAPYLLLDEPTGRLDEHGVEQLLGLLAAHRAAGGSAIIATHDQELLANLPGTRLSLT